MFNISGLPAKTCSFQFFPVLVFCFVFLLQSLQLPCLGAETFVLESPQKTITLTGFTRPRKSLVISSEVVGRCLSVSGNIGDVIRTSEPFIKIDPTFILLDIKTNQLSRKKLKRTITHNKQQLTRYQNLRSGQSVPQAQLDEIQLQHDVAVIDLESLKNNEKRLEELRKRHVITAPEGYRIIDRFIEPGEQINIGSRLAQLGDFRELLVPTVLTHEEIQALRSLSSIPIFLPDLDLTLNAQFHRIIPGFDPQSRKTKVELIIPKQQVKSPNQFHGGERVIIRIKVPDHLGAYIVPASALQERHNYFWLTAVDGSKKEVVFLGKINGDNHVQISGKDLKPGEHFLSDPGGTLRDEQRLEQ